LGLQGLEDFVVANCGRKLNEEIKVQASVATMLNRITEPCYQKIKTE
jgi:hypothetical protein